MMSRPEVHAAPQATCACIMTVKGHNHNDQYALL